MSPTFIDSISLVYLLNSSSLVGSTTSSINLMRKWRDDYISINKLNISYEQRFLIHHTFIPLPIIINYTYNYIYEKISKTLIIYTFCNTSQNLLRAWSIP